MICFPGYIRLAVAFVDASYHVLNGGSLVIDDIVGQIGKTVSSVRHRLRLTHQHAVVSI